MRIPRSAAAALLVLALAGCTPATPDAAPSETPKPTVTVEPTPSETAEAPVEEETFSADDHANIEAALNTGNTAAIEGYLTDPNSFIIAASECCGLQTPAETIDGLEYLQSATGPWTPATGAQVASYQAGFYAQYFAGAVLVFRSSDADPFVISFTVIGDQINGVFISAGESLLF